MFLAEKQYIKGEKTAASGPAGKLALYYEMTALGRWHVSSPLSHEPLSFDRLASAKSFYQHTLKELTALQSPHRGQ